MTIQDSPRYRVTIGLLLFFLALAGCAHIDPTPVVSSSVNRARRNEPLKRILVMDIVKHWKPIRVNEINLQRESSDTDPEITVRYELSFDQRLESGTLVTYTQTGYALFLKRDGSVVLVTKKPTETKAVLTPS